MAVETKAKTDALDANKESQATITTLRSELERNKAYQLDLDKRLKASEQKALKARKDFEDLKRKSPAVKWADQPLPDGLPGKPASTGKAMAWDVHCFAQSCRPAVTFTKQCSAISMIWPPAANAGFASSST